MTQNKTGIYKFDEPIPTKSGERVSILWKELLECWQSFKTARLNDDRLSMIAYAMKIQVIEDDLGITISKFPEIQDSGSVKG
jgi:hypothetical protein